MCRGTGEKGEKKIRRSEDAKKRGGQDWTALEVAAGTDEVRGIAELAVQGRVLVLVFVLDRRHVQLLQLELLEQELLELVGAGVVDRVSCRLALVVLRGSHGCGRADGAHRRAVNVACGRCLHVLNVLELLQLLELLHLLQLLQLLETLELLKLLELLDALHLLHLLHLLCLLLLLLQRRDDPGQLLLLEQQLERLEVVHRVVQVVNVCFEDGIW